MQRWKPDDEPFQLARDEANERQKRACLRKIYAKVVERWFLLSLKAKYAGMVFTFQKNHSLTTVTVVYTNSVNKSALNNNIKST